jgi:hypothetical protein
MFAITAQQASAAERIRPTDQIKFQIEVTDAMKRLASENDGYMNIGTSIIVFLNTPEFRKKWPDFDYSIANAYDGGDEAMLLAFRFKFRGRNLTDMNLIKMKSPKKTEILIKYGDLNNGN